MHPSAGFDRGLDHFAVLIDDVTAPVKDVGARTIGTILANNESLDRLVIGRRAFLTCHFDDRPGHRYFFGGTCPLPFTLRLWLRKCQRRQQCATDENGNRFLHIIPPIDVDGDGWLPFTKGFWSACCTKFRFLSSLAYLLQS